MVIKGGIVTSESLIVKAHQAIRLISGDTDLMFFRRPSLVFHCILLAMAILPIHAMAEEKAVFHAQGELAGEVTASSALLQSRLTAIQGPALDEKGDVPGAAGVACFEWSQSSEFPAGSSNRTQWLRADPRFDYMIRARITGLRPGTKIYYRLIFGHDRDHLQTGPTRQFETIGGASPVSFCMGSCMNYHAFMSGKPNGGGPVSATPTDKLLGYPVFESMAKLKPGFFIGTGDIVYYDQPAQGAARTLPEMRRKWHEQFRFPRLIDFFAGTATYWSKDDHDFRYNDADLGGKQGPDPQTGIEIFREQMPICETGDVKSPTYRTIRVSEDLQIWFVEGRDFRSPNSMPDGPDKTIWGETQKKWLQQTLKQSDATWKIIVTPTPLVGPDRDSKRDNHTNTRGFRHEGESFFRWLSENKIRNVISLCGDRHWQYHSIHPLGVEEFCVGALNDENAIAGERPGTARSTDPEGKIRQPYIYSQPTGGFLYVTLDKDKTITLQHRDDHGLVLNTVHKKP